MRRSSGSHAAGLRRASKALAVPDMLRARALRQQNIDLPSYQLVAVIAEHAPDLAVDQHDCTGAVGHDHAAGARFDGKAESFLGELAAP
jgi:hypothetical protein